MSDFSKISKLLLELLNNVSTWKDLELKISQIKKTKIQGDVFEEFCKLFFLHNSKYYLNIKNIFLWNNVPLRIKDKLNILKDKDYGIDIVIENKDGSVWSVQCKFRRNRELLSWSGDKISNFIGLSDKADYEIIFSNSYKVEIPIKKNKIGKILAQDLDNLEASFFEKIKYYLKDKKINRISKLKSPRPYQSEIINKTIEYFQNKDKGQLIMACGSGKTLVSLWIKECLKPETTAVFVPSLALLKQTFDEWASQRREDYFPICICSDQTVSADADEPHIDISEIGVPVTTNENELIMHLKKIDKPIIIFSTYQSSDILKKAISKINFELDFGIYDEAHKTSGHEGKFSASLKLPIKKKLFMTATPKIYDTNIKNKAKNEDTALYSMDDNSIYGEVIYNLTFGEAIDKEILVDYKIKVVCVTKGEVNELIQQRQKLLFSTKEESCEINADDFAKIIVLIKSLAHTNRIISFHSSIKRASEFISKNYGVPFCVELHRKKDLNIPHIETFHIRGEYPTSKRSKILNSFKQCKKAVITNARCLTEGVDCPAVDAVYFVDPKESLVDIVQATGRAIRRNDKEDKKLGYIIVPVFIEEDKKISEFLECSAFRHVWQVINAMKCQDERLVAVIDKIQKNKVWNLSTIEEKRLNKTIEFVNLPTKYDKTEFFHNLTLKTIEVLGSSWKENYYKLIKFKEEKNQWPSQHSKNFQEKNLAGWLTKQRTALKRNLLSEERKELLDNMSFSWDPLEDYWVERYNELNQFIKKKRQLPKYSINDTKESSMASWIDRQKDHAAKNKLSSTKMSLLEKLSITFSKRLDSLWCKKYADVKEFKKQKNRWPNQKGETKFERGLGKWCTYQREKYKLRKLHSSKKELLDKIDFPRSADNVRWKEKFEKVKKYKKRHKKWPSPNAKKFEERTVGLWCHRQRRLLKANKIKKDRKNQLDRISFEWHHKINSKKYVKKSQNER